MTKRILVVTTGFPANPDCYRGIFVFRAIKYLLQDTDYDLTVLVPQSDEPRDITPPNWRYSQRLKIVRYPYFKPKKWQLLTKGSIVGNVGKQKWLFLQTPFLLCAMAWNVWKWMRRCDLIHCQWTVSAWFPVLFKAFHGKPVVLNVHGSDLAIVDQGLMRKWNDWVFKRLNTFIVLTGAQEKMVLGRTGKIVIIPPGADQEIFYPLKEEEKIRLRAKLRMKTHVIYLIYVGMLIPVKGLDLLVDATAVLRQQKENLPEFKVIIIGGGIEKDNLLKRVKRLNCMDFVEFMGEKPTEEIPKWNQACDIAISTSHSEGLSTTLTEAAMCGLPIVATKAGQTDMIVEHGKSGFIIEKRNGGLFAKYCKTLISQKKLRKEMGEKAIQYMNRMNMTSQACAKGYADIYRSLINEP